MKYDFELEEWADNNSLTKIIKRIKKNSDVLEFGCANGRLTKYMKEKLGCKVTIVEIDQEAGKEASMYASKSFIGLEDGNIEEFQWNDNLKGEKYDFIIFADVLEHLRDPENVLSRCKAFLKEFGSIVVSIPNVGNNSLLASLYKNEFEYQNIGLLDNTHIKFYTYNTFKRMLGRLDYKMIYETGTYNKIGENEIPVSLNEIPKNLRKSFVERDFGDVYQFIFQFRNMDVSDSEIYQLESRFPINSTSYYETIYYLKNQNHISEFNTVHFPAKSGLSTHKIHIGAGEATAIRFDPINCNCIIKLHGAICETEELAIKETNAEIVTESLYFFTDEDPYIEFTDNHQNEHDIQIEFEILDYDFIVNDGIKHLFALAKGNVEAYITQMQISNNELDAQNQSANAQIVALTKEYESLKRDREIDLDNFKIQQEMLTKNHEDIQNLNTLVHELNDSISGKDKIIEDLTDYNNVLNDKINNYNMKSYHIRKIK